MKYSKLIAAGAIAVLLSACTGGNDQVATLPLTNEEMPVEVATAETSAETTETVAETKADTEEN